MEPTANNNIKSQALFAQHSFYTDRRQKILKSISIIVQNRHCHTSGTVAVLNVEHGEQYLRVANLE